MLTWCIVIYMDDHSDYLPFIQTSGFPPGRPKSYPPHGSRARYNHPQFPCRCGRCSEAKRAYQQAYRQKRKAAFLRESSRLYADGQYAKSEEVLCNIRTKS
jgi:hypothetical protein